jgi:MEDS: MEthanogen/methylotroph, DcmR Sensory domain
MFPLCFLFRRILLARILIEFRCKPLVFVTWIADMAWALEEKPGVEHLAEYCARLNHAVPKYHATVICTYDLARFTAAQVVDVLRSHPLAVICGIVQQNPFFILPDQLIREFQEPRHSTALS